MLSTYEVQGYKKAEEKLNELYKNGDINKESFDESVEKFKSFHNEDGENTMFKFIVQEGITGIPNLDICYAPPMSMTY